MSTESRLIHALRVRSSASLIDWNAQGIVQAGWAFACSKTRSINRASRLCSSASRSVQFG